jgi:TetR/AcrR family transcriptional regulator, transcriptional repressor for nem operon
MPRDGTVTRNAILDAAHALALEKGMAAASIDQVIERAGVTKGAFFYHFKSKDELALALVERFARQDLQMLDDSRARVEALSRDPLQQVLLLCGLAAEHLKELTDNPGCLFASYCYQGDLWSENVRKVCDTQIRHWSRWIEGKLRSAAKEHPPAVPLDLAQLAEMFTGVIEGGYILARTYGDPQIVARQLLTYRDLLEALFMPPRPARRHPRPRRKAVKA